MLKPVQFNRSILLEERAFRTKIQQSYLANFYQHSCAADTATFSASSIDSGFPQMYP